MEWSISEAAEYYRGCGAPSDQTALINLLKEVQQENGGGINESDVAFLSEELKVKPTLIYAVIKRIGSLKLNNSSCLEICSGPNCSKKADLLKEIEKTFGKNPRAFSIKFTGCMRMCKDGPNIRWNGKTYNRADGELIKKLAEKSL